MRFYFVHPSTAAVEGEIEANSREFAEKRRVVAYMMGDQDTRHGGRVTKTSVVMTEDELLHLRRMIAAE